MANSNAGLGTAIAELIQALTSLLPTRKVKGKSAESAPAPSQEAIAKVVKIWSGRDPNVISPVKCKRRVRRDWPTLAQALDELGEGGKVVEESSEDR